MKRILLVLCSLFLLLGTGIMLVSAHSLFPVGLLSCNLAATCPPTPTPQPDGNGHNPGDPDGDGIPNGIDQCPNDGGPSSNQGCPEGRNFSAGNPQAGLVTPSISNILLPILPTDRDVCVMATIGATPVNVRAETSTHARIVGTLDPHTIYHPDSELILLTGQRWIALVQPYGWVLASLMRLSPGCPYTLATYKQRPLPYLTPLSDVNAPAITLDKGSDGSDQPNGYCGVGYGIDIASADGVNNALHIVFGDGSVQPSPVQTCFKLDSDGHGFVLQPPVIPNATPLSIHFTVGFSPDNPNELVLIALLQPPVAPGESSPNPDKPGVTFTWSFLPPDPCKPGASSCDGSVRNFGIDWSQPGASDPGVAFSWNIAPPDPCKSGDQSCADSSGKQGVLIDFLPAVQNVAVNFFPNGFDPSVGGFTQIENQPGGSSPGDKYGFTQIENQPLTGQIAIDAVLPAVQ